jgi:hypothetical protein
MLFCKRNPFREERLEKVKKLGKAKKAKEN